MATWNTKIGFASSLGCLLWACGSPDTADGSSSASEQAAPLANAPSGAPGASTPATASPALPAGGGAGLAPLGNESSGPTGLTSGATGLPCEVATILEDHCSTCHGATPKFNAPMSLTSASDFSTAAPVSGAPLPEVTLRRVTAEGGARMPPPGTVDALEPAELATLTQWLQSGASPVANGCEVGAVSVAETSSLPTARPVKTGIQLEPYAGWDDDVTCYPFTAFAPGTNKQEPYRVGTMVDGYVGFGFTPPWQGTRYVRAFRSVIDNAQVLHHWLFFKEPGTQDDTAIPVVGAHPAGEMMAGWAPGASDQYFSPDLGMRMDSSESFLLELHYNSQDPGALDASGVELCVSETKPEHEAVVHWLGTDAISGTRSSGTCRPVSTEPIHIVSGTPHMHVKGSAMKVAVTRADGSTEVVHDEPFSFDNQRGYVEDIVINPGDSITTTCSFSAPSSFGRGTNEEMCYWFALAYPAGALRDNGLFGTLFHGQNACLGM